MEDRVDAAGVAQQLDSSERLSPISPRFFAFSKPVQIVGHEGGKIACMRHLALGLEKPVRCEMIGKRARQLGHDIAHDAGDPETVALDGGVAATVTLAASRQGGESLLIASAEELTNSQVHHGEKSKGAAGLAKRRSGVGEYPDG